MAVAKKQIKELFEAIEEFIPWAQMSKFLLRVQDTGAYQKNSSFRATINALWEYGNEKADQKTKESIEQNLARDVELENMFAAFYEGVVGMGPSVLAKAKALLQKRGLI